MAIVGIERLVYGVDDLAESVRFFEDFGLVRAGGAGEADVVRFVLPEGSSVEIRRRDDPALAGSRVEGAGVHEVIWGVRDAAALDRLAAGLAADHDVQVAADGTVRFVADFGVAMGLRLFAPNPVVTAPDPVNSPGRVGRLNQPRKWRRRACPKVISHVVFAVSDYEKGAAFMRERLGFRLSDVQQGFGQYLRGGAASAHHNLLLLNAHAPVPGLDGQLRFHHANFGVEDIDEIMIGANHMTRKGWPASHWGLGRHRIDSALFYYLPCPAGGEAEYGADGDVLDDGWVPRRWPDPLFGMAHYMANLPPFLLDEPAWRFEYLTDDQPPLVAEQPGVGH